MAPRSEDEDGIAIPPAPNWYGSALADWGVGCNDIYAYAAHELEIKSATVDKLTGTFAVMQEHAPQVLQRDGIAQPIPSMARRRPMPTAAPNPERGRRRIEPTVAIGRTTPSVSRRNISASG